VNILPLAIKKSSITWYLSVRNLEALLGERGFTVVAVERGPAHQPVDLALALMLAANRMAGPPQKPWLEPRRWHQRIRWGVLFSLLAPWMVLTLVLDRAIAPLRRRRPGGSNTYRVLARRV
jgi:hypothetical protein